MAREAWPKPSVIEAGKDVVCLAVYRWRKDEATTGSPKGGAAKTDTQDSEWAIRLDVKAYPQIRLLDGWGRPLRSSSAHEMDRTVDQVVAGMNAAKSEGKKPRKPDVPKVPAKLLARVAEKERDAVTDPIGSVRCRAWLRAMEKGTWTSAELVALFETDDDPVLRLRILERLSETKLGPSNGDGYDDAVVDAVAKAVDGDNDYVRGASLRLLGKAGGAHAVQVLRDTIAAGLDGKTGWKNPNNVLCEAIEASIAAPDKSLADVLGRVLATQAANNYATVLATRSLVAVGKKCGADVVRAHLERARKMEGPLAGQIRKEVEGFLGK